MATDTKAAITKGAANEDLLELEDKETYESEVFSTYKSSLPYGIVHPGAEPPHSPYLA